MNINEALADFIRQIVRAELDAREPRKDDRPLTVEQAALEMGVSQKTVRRWISSGKLPAVIVGKRYQIRREALEKIPDPAQVTIDAESIATRLLGS